ncbi:MAG: ATP-binding cassette domain-containing protein, partial [Candidatus Lokiarchaeota archaeon]|nr:ATP-binding cassette domain-containing protein [Candidatus Lokiarchaeota archaeon]MBD3200465.1 ATP-binding cassette domain-containing protein [Candidatus Lokiarchaeota archaeon]
MKNHAIKVKNLTKYFGTLRAVNEIDFNISQGKTYGLLGPNGAGKTTIIRLLNGIISKTSGNIQIEGYNIDNDEDKKKIKYICGFLPESPGIYSKLSAREFLQFMGDLFYLPRNLSNIRITELLSIFQLLEREDELLESFSRGMKQKVCICAALIQDPDIIFLDEPTSNLDPAAARMVKNLILELADKANKTIFICTHLLDAAEELCDE